MKYRLLVDLLFDDPAYALSVMNHIAGIFPHAVTINKGQVTEERSYAISQLCYHDEDSTRPCEVTGTLTTL